jgi:periplasmic protein TonB
MENLERPVGESSSSTESRVHPRCRLTPMVYVELAQGNGGILLNISEGGLALQSALMLVEDQFREIRFQLPGSREWIKATGRVAWMRDSKTEAGVAFEDISAQAQARIRDWVGAASSPLIAAGDGGSEREQAVWENPVAADSMTDRGRPARAGRFNGSSGPSQGYEYEADNRTESGNGVHRLGPLIPAGRSGPTPSIVSDYSMFGAADSHLDRSWATPGERRRSGRGLFLLTILIAALFFVLGATIGRGSLDQGIKYAETLWNGEETLKTQAPPAPTVTKGSTSTARPPVDEPAAPHEAAPPANKADEVSAPREAPAPSPKPAAPLPGVQTQQQAAKNSRPQSENTGIGSIGDAARPPGRSILVTAPPAGSPPFLVNLSDEAVSASAAVAISSRRSFMVRPISGSYSSRAERVMIGSLVSHGEPFYPTEARRKRIEGTVELRALIGPRGEIASVEVVSGPPLLAAAALEAVRDWRYEPTFINGDPIALQNQITIVFRLR